MIDWQVQYDPLITSSATIAAEWSEIQGAYDNLAMKIYDAGPMAMDVLVQSIEHNFAYLDQALTNTAWRAHENQPANRLFSSHENMNSSSTISARFASYNDWPTRLWNGSEEFETRLEETP